MLVFRYHSDGLQRDHLKTKFIYTHSIPPLIHACIPNYCNEVFHCVWASEDRPTVNANSLDVGEEVGHDSTEQFEIVHQELGHVHISDGTQRYQLLSKVKHRSN